MKKAPLYKSFGYAFAGIFACLKKERNIKIHLCFTAAVIFFGFFLRISAVEWCICLALFGLVLSLEIVNTAIEAVVDLVTEEKKPLAGLAKDAAAGAVLTAAICSAVAGLIIFLPKGIAFLQTHL
uniref:diacylglycerol kinase family protein n=1 Tax=Eubacterium cellulosolvens TaxID=29322 RepID=UPI000485AF1C|nr:diacylglycerol kinase family protein [[Eubacterium] cellulosolvens]